MTFLLNTGSVQEAASLLLSSLAAASDGSASAGRLTRAEAARVLKLRSDLSMAEGLRDLLELEDDED